MKDGHFQQQYMYTNSGKYFNKIYFNLRQIEMNTPSIGIHAP